MFQIQSTFSFKTSRPSRDLTVHSPGQEYRLLPPAFVMNHTIPLLLEWFLCFYCGSQVYSEISLRSSIWTTVFISKSQYLNSFTIYKNRTSVGAYIIIFLITEQRSPGKIPLSRCRFKMADGTMSGELEILNSVAKRSDQLRSLTFAPLRQLMPVEKKFLEGTEKSPHF